MRVSASTVLPAPADEAWAGLMRWEDQARWMKDADSVRVLTRAREGVGVQVAVKTRVFGVPAFTERLEVVGWDPPRRLVIAHRSFLRGIGTWVLEPTPAGARFTWTEELALPIPVLGELALLAYRPFLHRLMRGALERLRRYLRST